MSRAKHRNIRYKQQAQAVVRKVEKQEKHEKMLVAHKDHKKRIYIQTVDLFTETLERHENGQEDTC